MRAGGGRIAIIGAGLSGTALAIQLLRRGGGPVALIERGDAFGPGLAYGTRCERHLLNVRSGRMSLFPDQPGHFTDWLARMEQDADPEGFARRMDYGRYIQACMAEAQAGAPGRLSIVQGEVVEVRSEEGCLLLMLADGRRLAAAQAVLATGNPPPARLALKGLERLDGGWIPDPWAPGALAGIGPEEDVLLVGTGLTAIDVLLALEAGGWRGRAVALSRRGLLPRTHGPRGEQAVGGVPDGGVSAKLHEVRRRVGNASWTAVMDGLRPHGQALWREASPTERRRFLRHLRPWWDVHRHRMAPEIGAAVQRLRETGRLEAAAGRLVSVESDGTGLAVRWRPRGRPEETATRADRLINCTGPQSDPSRAGEPLLDQLLAEGAARPDPLRLGLDVDDDGRLLDQDGRPHPRLWAMGPPSRGVFWEIVAVPEIRDQAAALAARLAPEGAAASGRRRISHLEEVGETYMKHMGVAWGVGGQLFLAGAACMIHGLAPWLFTHSASRTIVRLHGRLMARHVPPAQ